MFLSYAVGSVVGTAPARFSDSPRSERPASAAVEPQTAAIDATLRRVLVVEDNADSRETLRMLVELWGHRVEVAADGAEGIRMALANPPDVAVIDIGLPLVNGYDVARRLRAAFGSGTRLIALTAYARPEDRRRALEAGFDFFMSKPADLDALARLVSR